MRLAFPHSFLQPPRVPCCPATVLVLPKVLACSCSCTRTPSLHQLPVVTWPPHPGANSLPNQSPSAQRLRGVGFISQLCPIDEETEAQGGFPAGPKPHSEYTKELRREPRA